MNIAVNLLFLDKNYVGGISQFARGLMKGLSLSIPENSTITIFCKKNTAFAVEDISSNEQIKIVYVEESNSGADNYSPSRIPYQIKYRLPLRLISFIKFRDFNRILNGFDLVYVPHGPTAIFPFPRVPTVYSIHDIQHEYFPHFFTKEQLLGRKTTFRLCARHAASLQASSTFMKDNFLETFTNFDERDIFLAFEGVDREFWAIRDYRAHIQALPMAPETPYIFLPAQLWMHKNHITIFKALKQLRMEGQEVHLVLTGARFESSQPIFDKITELEIGDLVHYLGIVSREDLRWLYQNARAVLSAALYESSSLPILEAAANNVPIIAGDTFPNIEMGHNISIDIVSNLDPAAWASAIKRNCDFRSRNVSHDQSLEKYDWATISKIYWEEFSRLTK